MIVLVLRKRFIGFIAMMLVAASFGCMRDSSAESPSSSSEKSHKQTQTNNHTPPPIAFSRVMNSRFEKSSNSPQRKPASSNSLQSNNQKKQTKKTSPWQPEVDPKSWKYIVLHHTATSKGSVASIHKIHLQRVDSRGNPWRGIGYHFVIGNGNGMKDGQIEQTFRWTDQTDGAHAGNANYNQSGIGICLIGNFDKTRPTKKQLASLKQLLKELKGEYSINSKNIVAHKSVKATHCPGKYFPMHLFSQPKVSNKIHRRSRFKLR